MGFFFISFVTVKSDLFFAYIKFKGNFKNLLFTFIKKRKLVLKNLQVSLMVSIIWVKCNPPTKFKF